MIFDDGINLEQLPLNDKVVFYALKYIKQKFHTAKDIKEYHFYSAKMLEYIMKCLKITSFDFISEINIMKIENAIRYMFEFLQSENVIKKVAENKEEFYRMLIRQNLYANHEFSNEFEINFYEKLYASVDAGYEYVFYENFNRYYNLFKVNYAVIKSNKIVNIALKNRTEVKVLALSMPVATKHLNNAVEYFDYSALADFIAFYNKRSNHISVAKTNDDISSKMLNDVFITIDLSKKNRDEFII